MNEEGYRALNQIFTFDYMGIAEFEFGAVPKAIEAIAKGFSEGNGVTGQIVIDGVPVYYLTHKNAEKEKNSDRAWADKVIKILCDNGVDLK